MKLAQAGDVKGRDPRHSSSPCSLRRRRQGRHSLRTGGRQHYHVQIRRGQTCGVQRPQGRLMRQGRDGFRRCPRDAAFTIPVRSTIHSSLVSTICSRSGWYDRTRQITASTQNFAMHRVLLIPVGKDRFGDLQYCNGSWFGFFAASRIA